MGGVARLRGGGAVMILLFTSSVTTFPKSCAPFRESGYVKTVVVFGPQRWWVRSQLSECIERKFRRQTTILRRLTDGDSRSFCCWCCCWSFIIIVIVMRFDASLPIEHPMYILLYIQQKNFFQFTSSLLLIFQIGATSVIAASFPRSDKRPPLNSTRHFSVAVGARL